MVNKMWALWEDVIFICDWNVSPHLAPPIAVPRQKGHLDNFPPFFIHCEMDKSCIAYMALSLYFWTRATTPFPGLPCIWYLYARFEGLRLVNSWLLTPWCNYKSLLLPFWASEQTKTQTYRIVRRWLTKNSFFFFLFFFSLSPSL